MLSPKKQSDDEQHDAERRDIPNERMDQRDPGGLEGHIRDASPEVEPRTSLGERVVRVRYVDREDDGGDQRKRLHEVAQCPIQAPGHTPQRGHLLVSRIGRLSVTALQTRGMRGHNNLSDAQHNATRYYSQLDGHKRTSRF